MMLIQLTSQMTFQDVCPTWYEDNNSFLQQLSLDELLIFYKKNSYSSNKHSTLLAFSKQYSNGRV